MSQAGDDSIFEPLGMQLQRYEVAPLQFSCRVPADRCGTMETAADINKYLNHVSNITNSGCLSQFDRF